MIEKHTNENESMGLESAEKTEYAVINELNENNPMQKALDFAQ